MRDTKGDRISDERLDELLVLAGGPEEVAKARREAEDAAKRGDTAAEQYWTKLHNDLKAAAERLAAEAQRRQSALRAFDLRSGYLVGGITGVLLDPSTEVPLAPGIVLRDTYAHLMLPSVVATARPPAPSSPHPGPWFQAGGVGADVLVEVAVQGDIQTSGFDALNAAWLAIALVRLRVNPEATMPMIASVPLATLTSSTGATLLPIEAAPTSLFRLPVGRQCAITSGDLEWLAAHYLPASQLCKDTGFSTAFMSFDEAHSSRNLRSRMLILWSALEGLLRPGRPNTGDRLGKAMAVLLATTVTHRDEIFRDVRDRYQRRGDIAHASLTPTAAEIEGLGVLASRCFQRVIEIGEIPKMDMLLSLWRTRSAN